MKPPVCSFQVVTIANDLAQYAEMRRSFENAGFTADRTRFTVYDNSRENRHEPYGVLRGLPDDGSEPCVVFCHQDVRLDLGHGYDQLAAQVALLNARHPNWAAAGNSGGGDEGRMLLHLDDPAGRWREDRLPLNARSLDENFLLLRRDGGLFGSPGLTGFHFYGTDVCLNAIARGKTAHVIDFLLTHLSGGNRHSAAFTEARDRLVQHWQPRFLAGIVQTTCTEIVLSSSRTIRNLLGKRRVRQLLSALGNPLIRNPL